MVMTAISFLIGLGFSIDYMVFVGFALFWISAIVWILAFQLGLLKKYRITGKISVNGDRIADSESEHLLKKFDLIRLNYRGYKGLWIGKKYCYGDRNTISLTNESFSKKYRILLESKSELNALKSVLEQWYGNDFPLKETGILNRDSLLLQTNLSHVKRQQELKRLSELKNKTVANNA